MPDEKFEQPDVASEKLADAVRDAINTFKSPDMDTDRVGARINTMNIVNGISRTNVLGAAAYIAINGPIVGITKDQLVGLIDGIYDATVAHPKTAEMAVTYAEANAKAHMNAEAKKHLESAADAGVKQQAILVPGSGKVH